MSTTDESLFVQFIQSTGRGSGIADLAGFSESARETLQIMKLGYTEALKLERGNDPSRPTDTRFYFNYIESQAINAVAFKVGNVRFIGVTIALLNKAVEHSYRLRQSDNVQRALGLNAVQRQRVGIAFFNLLVSFVVTHEYGHHYWAHVDAAPLSSIDEFNAAEDAGLDRQVREIVADGYGAYLVMHQLLQGDLRQAFVSTLGLETEQYHLQNRILLSLLIIVIGSFFAIYMTGPFDPGRALTVSHPPPATRMAFLMEHVQLFVTQNRGVELDQWFNGDVYRRLVRAATDEVNPALWIDESRFRLSPDGIRYVDELTGRVNAAKRAGQAYR